eukprot:TRINITY_DN1436_c0_g1_i1.p1 TRINITY_DN1436_c0_g1~~TRINITY_DN1436_c0_g1_i1.p1  ORF type:complete len:488 (+),score=168.10 TRINITY_DN1436_c0_g1_i1:30-1466(+)
MSKVRSILRCARRSVVSGIKNIGGPDSSEGDINLSRNRAAYMERNIGEETQKVIDEDAKYFLHQTLSTPCMNVLEAVEGIYLVDKGGRRYMDFHGNSVHQVGHKNEAVIAALKQQLDDMPFCPRRFTNDKAVGLAKKLVNLAHNPNITDDDEQLSRVLLCTGGTSGIGIALKLARISTGNHKTISMWESFHGASLDAISIGGESVFRKNIGPLLPGTCHAPPPNEQSCIYNCNGNCNLSCAKYVEYMMDQEEDICAVIAEPIRWTPYIPKKEYWEIIRKACDRHGALLIFDEIPNSLGRTGQGMFTYQMFPVQPDIVVLGKGLGGGVVPLAAVLAKEKFNKYAATCALGHYTHEKAPLGSTAALATIKYIEDNNLVGNAKIIGEHALTSLKALQAKHPFIANVRGAGLLIGIELVNPHTRTAAKDEAEKVLYNCLERGLSFKVTRGNVLTLCPPLIITKEQMDEAIGIIDASLTAVGI